MLALGIGQAAFASAETGSGDPFLVRLTENSEVPLPGTEFYPEGIAVSRVGDLYVGSLAQNEVWKLDRQTRKIERFSSAEAGLHSVIGIHVAHDQRTLHACSSDPKGAFPGSRSELVTFDLQTGTVVRRASLPPGGLCNDIAETDDGTILLTDSFGARIFSIASDETELTVWSESMDFVGEGFGLNGIANLNGSIFAVKYNSGELFRFSKTDQGVSHERVTLQRPLEGPDGLEPLNDGTLLVVEGYSGSVSVIDISTGSVEVLAGGLDSPTTAAIHEEFVYVVQGQLDHFFGMTQTPPGPFGLKRVNLHQVLAALSQRVE